MSNAVRGSQSARRAEVVEADGRLDLELPSVKASIEFAHTDAGWIAEFRFRFRGGAYQACALPLTTSSEALRSKAQAVAGAARRLQTSAEEATRGDPLSKAQAAALDALKTWCGRIAADTPADRPLPLTGLRFLDLFAGIGGFHAALADLGAACAGAVEIDLDARETYRRNHGGAFPLVDDVRACHGEMFGRVDIVCGGFPCQSFSVAGDGEGLGHETKGGLFFELARLIGELAPNVALLENVKGLCALDDGKVYDEVVDRLAKLGYSVSARVLDAGAFGLAQSRERLFLVCVHERAIADRSSPYVFPRGANATRVVADILEPRGAPSSAVATSRLFERSKPCPASRGQAIEIVGHIDGRRQQGYRVASALGKGFTLCANSGGVGGRTGLYMVGNAIRGLTPRECARMQGFPEWFAPHPSPPTALKQFGNSVAVPVVRAIAERLADIVQRARRWNPEARLVPTVQLGVENFGPNTALRAAPTPARSRRVDFRERPPYDQDRGLERAA